MLNNDKQEMLIQRLIERIQQLNEDILVTIGESINKLSTIQPNKIHQIKQMLLYGENLDKIVNEIPPEVLSYTLENKPIIPESFAPTNAA